MKKIITWKLLFAFAATILLQDVTAVHARPAEAQSGAKYSLAVLDLEGSGRVSSADADDLSERLREELRRAGVFQVMEKSALKSALAARNLNMSGCSTKECAIQIGRAAGTKLVIAGSVSKVGPIYLIQAQLVHVKSGEVVESVREDFDGEFESLQNHMAVVARKLSGQNQSASTSAAPSAYNPSSRDEMSQASATEQSNAMNPEQDTFDFQERAVSNKSSKGGGNTALVIGLVAVGAIGGGLLINQALKKDDNGNGGTNPPPVNGNLPNPPTFP